MKNITILGGGVLGSQIAFQTSYSGYNVTIYLRSKESIKRCKKKLEEVKNSYDPIKYNIESLRNVLKEIYPDQMKNVFNNLKQGIGSMEDKYNNLHN